LHRKEAAVITARLQAALQRLDELASSQQDEIARVIERQFAPATMLPSYAGSMPDLPDDFEAELMRRRHEVPPTLPMDDQMRVVFGDDTACGSIANAGPPA
jgi:hypothetical protein